MDLGFHPGAVAELCYPGAPVFEPSDSLLVEKLLSASSSFSEPPSSLPGSETPRLQICTGTAGRAEGHTGAAARQGLCWGFPLALAKGVPNTMDPGASTSCWLKIVINLNVKNQCKHKLTRDFSQFWSRKASLQNISFTWVLLCRVSCSF